MLDFVIHEVSWEYGSDWCFGLQEDEELQIFEGQKFCNLGVFFYFCDEEEEAIFCFGFLLWFFNGFVIWWLGRNVLPHCQVFFSKK
jgi:hypothetical protein